MLELLRLISSSSVAPDSTLVKEFYQAYLTPADGNPIKVYGCLQFRFTNALKSCRFFLTWAQQRPFLWVKFMSLQMPPSELEQRRQLNDQAMSDVSAGGVTEMAGDPVQLAGKIPSSVVDQLLSTSRGRWQRTRRKALSM